jgi:hypothetical protein
MISRLRKHHFKLKMDLLVGATSVETGDTASKGLLSTSLG